ncbi:tape measure protein [Salinicola sp. JS01]|uniref:tape measure protein n=1 Tax=Salinicola sp. JS01 TaxID=3050071 RepID=UPI00255BE19B|nr:tape measure protein [Salinicola sp. JS01]WIX34964.1 tape measure protein [Salinicola sp. JS01]
MADNLTLKVTLRGDGRHLSGTLRDASGEVREFGSTSDRSGRQSSAAFERTGRSVRSVNRDVADLNRVSDLARNSLLALGGAFSVREVINYSDAWTNTTNQIRTVSDSNERLIASQQRLMAIANDTRTSYESTANLYARLSRATTGLNLGYERTYRLVEIINKSFAVSGATAEEASAAIVQLSQGLAAGALRGDEFNSVSEQAPAIMYAIADSLNMTLGELRAFASSGGITAEIVVNALEKAAAGIDKTFGGAIASFGQKMTVARNEMIEWVGTSQQVSDAVGLTGDAILGLTGHMDELVTIGTVLATVYGGRVAGALAASAAGYAARTVATIRDTQAQREAAAAEAGRQLALARTAAAEKTAEANNASLAARRALTARQDAANHATSLQQVRVSLVAERELEAQRLKAQISATGRQQSVARMAELRRSEATVTNQLTAANAKLAQAEAGVTSASRAATLASAEQAAATRAATTAQAAYTGAMRASTAAAGAMATAARGASAALALLGGPVGAALVAVGALYAFREELGLVSAKANATREEVDELTGSLDGLTDAQIRNKRASLVRDLVEARIEAEKLEKQFSALEKQNRDQMVTNQGRPGSAWFLQQELSPKLEEAKAVAATLEKGLDTFDQKVDRLRQSATSGVKIFKTLDQWMFNTGDAADKAGKSLSKAAKAHENALRGLLDKLDPVAKSQRDFLADQITLQTAWAGGKLTLDQYLTAVGQLPKLYQNAGYWADVYSSDGTKAAKTVSREMTATETIIKRSLERTDDAFVDFWEKVISGGKNTFDAFKQVAISTLAEIAHAYTTRRITASLGLPLAGTGSPAAGGTGAGGMGGFGGGGGFSMPSFDSLSGAWTTAQNAWAGFNGTYGASLGVQGGISGTAIGSANSVVNGTGIAGASNTAFGAGTTTAGLATAITNAIAYYAAYQGGGMVGNKIGTSLTGKTPNSNIGQMLGTVGGSFWGVPGAFVGSTIGGVVDSIFGSSRKYTAGFESFAETPDRDFGAGGTPYYSSGYYRDGDLGRGRETPFGSFGFTDKTKFEPSDMIDLLDAMAALDQTLASAANETQIESVKNALDGWQTRLKNDSLGELVARRYAVVSETLENEASEATAKLIERVGEITADSAERTIPQLAQALQLGNLIDGLSGNVKTYAEKVVDDTSTSLEDAFSQITAGVAAHAAVSGIADELNLTFDDMGERAVEAALNLQELAGGLDALQSQAQTYYANFFSAEEQRQRAIDQISPTLEAAGLSAESTRAQFRAVVESLDLNTESGRQTYSELMSVAGAFAQLSESAADAAKRAEEIERQRWSLQNDLLRAQGNGEAALARERQRQLEQMPETLRALQQEIWAIDERNKAAEQQALLQRTALYRDGTVGAVNSIIDRYQTVIDVAQTAADERRQQLEDERRGIESLRSAIDSLALSDQSILDPMARLAEARDQFARQSVLAETDPGAIGDTQQSGRAYLDSVAAAYGHSSTQYAQAYQEVQSTYRSLEQQYGESLDKLGSLESIDQQLLREQQRARDTLSDQLRAQIAQSDALTSIADLIDLMPDRISQALSDIFPEYANNDVTGQFDEAAYLVNKRDQLNQTAYEGHTDWTIGDVSEAFDAANLTAREHYQQYGRDEGVVPYYRESAGGGSAKDNADPTQPRYDEATYLKNKTAQVNRIRQDDRDDWTVTDVAAAMQQSGMTPYEHWLQFGRAEGIPAYASGGVHSGGWALVGEQGPEYVDLGPSRIYNATETRQLMAPPPVPSAEQGSGNEEQRQLIRAVERLSQDNAALRRQNDELIALMRATADNTGRGADASDRTADNTERTERNTRTRRRGVGA